MGLFSRSTAENTQVDKALLLKKQELGVELKEALALSIRNNYEHRKAVEKIGPKGQMTLYAPNDHEGFISSASVIYTEGSQDWDVLEIQLFVENNNIIVKTSDGVSTELSLNHFELALDRIKSYLITWSSKNNNKKL